MLLLPAHSATSSALALEMAVPSSARKRLAYVVLTAVLLMCIQLGIGLAQATGATLGERYLSLMNWDGKAYERIARVGYEGDASNPTTDAVWFPGHSMVIRAVHALTGTSWTFSTVAASQLACIFFWTYFLLLLIRFRVSLALRVFAIAIVLSYPASFFLISGYSESLFIGAILGMFYWMDDDRKYAWIVATAFAFIASMTRITAIAFIPIPILYGIYFRTWKRTLPQSVALLSGSVLLFSFFWFKFGDFFLYYHRSHDGWGTTPLGLFDLKLGYLWFQHPIVELAKQVTNGSGFALSSFLFVVVTDGILLLVGTDIVTSILSRDGSIMKRLVFYLGAIATLYLSFTANFTIGMPGMSRYMLPAVVLGALGIMHFLSQHRNNPLLSSIAEILMPVCVVFFAPLHWMYVHYYVLGYGYFVY